MKKLKVTSLRFRMLLPVIVMTLFAVALLTTFFSRAYTDTIIRQEQDVNTVRFDTLSRTITPLIESSVSEVRTVITDDRIVSCARNRYASTADLIHARIRCRDFLQAEISRQEGIFGLFFMREDGSLFGALPGANLFLDDPAENPLPQDVKSQILNSPRGEVVWTGPLSASILYGYEKESSGKNLMICAWKSVDVSFGECYSMMLMDESVFDSLFAPLEDGKSTWRIFSGDKVEFYHSGSEESMDPDRLIAGGSSGYTFNDENGHPVCAFSMTMTSPAWTLVREVSMESSAEVVSRVRRIVWITAGAVFLIALFIYHLWLKGFMRQFETLLRGIVRMGEGELEPIAADPFTIDEFETMHREIDRTSLALTRQMDTIRRMEREQMELENKRREQEQLLRELSMARQIQGSMLPHIFPPFPDRKEIDLFASMDPARDVGGDFYDFFFIDEDHLCLVIADVSGKGIPAALFMMLAKRIIEDFAMVERSVSRILTMVNEALCDNNQAGMFVTVWLGILEISTGRLSAGNAGHEFPVIRKKDSAFELYKDRHGFVLGGMEGIRYMDYELSLSPGDKLFVYTDGLPEANAENGEMFGTDRMLDVLNACGSGSPEEILRTVKERTDAFVGEAEQFDDLTMMCLEYRGPRQAE